MFFFQAEDGIRYLVRSRGLGDVYKRQGIDQHAVRVAHRGGGLLAVGHAGNVNEASAGGEPVSYTHLDAADERSSVDLGGRRII